MKVNAAVAGLGAALAAELVDGAGVAAPGVDGDDVTGVPWLVDTGVPLLHAASSHAARTPDPRRNAIRRGSPIDSLLVPLGREYVVRQGPRRQIVPSVSE